MESRPRPNFSGFWRLYAHWIEFSFHFQPRSGEINLFCLATTTCLGKFATCTPSLLPAKIDVPTMYVVLMRNHHTPSLDHFPSLSVPALRICWRNHLLGQQSAAWSYLPHILLLHLSMIGWFLHPQQRQHHEHYRMIPFQYHRY